MLKLAITLANGERVQINVIQAEFVRECPHCKIMGRPDVEFRTIDVDQKFCKTSHRVAYWQKTHITSA